MVKLELREFAEATRRMVELSGVKKSRLMLRVRPNNSRKTFILKSTDGRTTLTTRITHQGELKMVEGIVNDFVTQCTAALVVPVPKTTATTGVGAASTAQPQSPSAQQQSGSGNRGEANVHASTTAGNAQPASTANKGGGKSGGKAAGASGTQQQQGNKKRKGGRR